MSCTRLSPRTCIRAQIDALTLTAGPEAKFVNFESVIIRVPPYLLSVQIDQVLIVIHDYYQRAERSVSAEEERKDARQKIERQHEWWGWPSIAPLTKWSWSLSLSLGWGYDSRRPRKCNADIMT
ncbi:uncharacterized protein EAE98_004188 [Botrytis deweyae]|uniref:Uncharacterized protein n=1 Tax=Botrytis deweyae TaxID=2478750 RepID=A0ABQ7ITP3_9HELO|nr:uncharacterized protein EAE98_004188 [Botrytis deweyae]KAF7932889.1 hypothetical protein EAE98_004188 [Botrytis deweyae]